MRNTFKELDLIDRVPDELWMEVHDIVQEAVIKTIPKKKKCKKKKKERKKNCILSINTNKTYEVSDLREE